MTYSIGHFGSKQVDAIQFALIAGGHGDLVLGDLARPPSGCFFQHLDRHLLVLRLRLEQDDGSDVRRILLGLPSASDARDAIAPVHRVSARCRARTA